MSKDIHECNIKGDIHSDQVILGKGVTIEEGVVISGKVGPAKKVVIGDYAYIGMGVKIFAPEFCLGDYSKLHAHSFAHGEKPCQIGRNCWIGGNVILDSMGGLDIDDNVGIGAHSQLWTHIQFGDIVEGCRFYSKKYMHVQKDAWFVGHCVVSPVEVGEKSMAMVGSVVTKDMKPNHIYAGVPAKDVSPKLGHQFEERSPEEKARVLQNIIDEFLHHHPQYQNQLSIIQSEGEEQEGVTCFNVANRTYTRHYSEGEVAFLKSHVPLVKFVPQGVPSFFETQKNTE